MLKKIFGKIIKIKTENRSDTVVYTLLLFFWAIGILLFLTNVLNSIAMGNAYRGNPLLPSFVTILVISFILYVYRKGYRGIINCIFLALLFICCVYIILRSGPENPYAILLMVFYIVIAAIMFSGRRFFLSIFSIVAGYLLMGYLEIHNLIKPDLSWKVSSTASADIIGVAVLLSIIIFISHLFNKEINAYISKLEESERLLKKERDLLEIRVKERTAQLQTEQLDKLSQLGKLAEFGRLAQGLIHDLTNPLTAISLNLGELKKEKYSSKIKGYFDEVAVASESMKKLIESTLAYSQNRLKKDTFSIAGELQNAKLVCGYKARQSNVELNFQEKNDMKLLGNRTRFSQLICNLILNAVEAYEHQKNEIKSEIKKEISIVFHRNKDKIIIKVIDNAFGIPEEISKQIFQPFFSTKKQSGNSGIGLSTCKDIVENDFFGNIKVKSSYGVGSEFIITIPQASQGQNE